MIIIEGADGTGKTTLAKLLAEKLSMDCVKIPRHKSDPELNGFKFYMQEAQEISSNSVVDRFHIGECVYPELYEDDLRSPLSMWQQHAIERLLQIRGCLLIHVSADPKFIKQSYLKRGDVFDETMVLKEDNLFATHCFNSLLRREIFIPGWTDEEKFISKIKKIHDDLIKQITPFQHYHGTGSVNSPVMLVGHEVNNKYHTPYAFHAWSGGSAYLHQALTIAHCRKNWYLTNAFKTDEPKQEFRKEPNIYLLMKEYYDISPSQVIALGTPANKMLNQCEIEHTLIPHPAHHMRFHHDVHAYANLISEVIT